MAGSTPSRRARAAALLLASFLATGLAAPVVHQARHRPDHVHGPTPADVLGVAETAAPPSRAAATPAAAAVHAPAPSPPRPAPPPAAPRVHSHAHGKVRHSHPAPPGRPAQQEAPQEAPQRPAPAPPPAAPASSLPDGQPPAPHDAPPAPDHGAGSIAHFALAMLAAPAPLALPAPAEALTAPPARPYASRRETVVRPRASRAPPA